MFDQIWHNYLGPKIFSEQRIFWGCFTQPITHFSFSNIKGCIRTGSHKWNLSITKDSFVWLKMSLTNLHFIDTSTIILQFISIRRNLNLNYSQKLAITDEYLVSQIASPSVYNQNKSTSWTWFGSKFYQYFQNRERAVHVLRSWCEQRGAFIVHSCAETMELYSTRVLIQVFSTNWLRRIFTARLPTVRKKFFEKFSVPKCRSKYSSN